MVLWPDFLKIIFVCPKWENRPSIGSGPFTRFSTCVLQNACVNTAWHVMVCNVYSPLTFSNRLCTNALSEKLRPMFYTSLIILIKYLSLVAELMFH